jgi:hypothetical protein
MTADLDKLTDYPRPVSFSLRLSSSLTGNLFDDTPTLQQLPLSPDRAIPATIATSSFTTVYYNCASRLIVTNTLAQSPAPL